MSRISDQRIDQAARNLEFVANEIVYAAALFFEECPDDFGFQSGGAEGCVFGGTNRLLWSPLRGFRPDPNYCTQKFLDHAKTILGER